MNPAVVFALRSHANWDAITAGKSKHKRLNGFTTHGIPAFYEGPTDKLAFVGQRFEKAPIFLAIF